MTDRSPEAQSATPLPEAGSTEHSPDPDLSLDRLDRLNRSLGMWGFRLVALAILFGLPGAFRWVAAFLLAMSLGLDVYIWLMRRRARKAGQATALGG